MVKQGQIQEVPFAEWLKVCQPDDIEGRQALLHALREACPHGRYQSIFENGAVTLTSRNLVTVIQDDETDAAIQEVEDLDIFDPNNIDQVLEFTKEQKGNR